MKKMAPAYTKQLDNGTWIPIWNSVMVRFPNLTTFYNGKRRPLVLLIEAPANEDEDAE